MLLFAQTFVHLPVLMAGVIVNQPNPLPAWRARSPLNLTPPLHNLPQYFDKLLPKFDPEERIAIDDHLQSFYLAVEGATTGKTSYFCYVTYGSWTANRTDSLHQTVTG